MCWDQTPPPAQGETPPARVRKPTDNLPIMDVAQKMLDCVALLAEPMGAMNKALKAQGLDPVDAARMTETITRELLRDM